MNFPLFRPIACSFGLLACSQLAGATTIFVDFGSSSLRHSVGSADSNGNWWSYVTGITDSGLTLANSADGSDTGYDIGFSGTVGTDGGPGTYNGALTPDSGLNGGSFAFPDVTDDAIFFNGSASPTITISGLSATDVVSFTFYGSRVTTDDRFTTYAIGTDSVQLQTSGSSLTDDWNGDTVVSLNDISPSSGEIAIDLSSSTGASGANFGYINAMEISVVPEPSAALLAMAGAGLFGLRRRRN